MLRTILQCSAPLLNGAAALALVGLLAGCAPAGRTLSVEEQVVREQRLVSLIAQGTALLRRPGAANLEQARAAFELAGELSPRDARVLDGLGCVAWRRGNFSAARSYFSEAIRADPGYDRALAHMALIAFRDGNFPEADELFRRALILNPLNYRARNNFVVSKLRRGVSAHSQQILLRELRKALYSAMESEEVIYKNIGELNRTASREGEAR